MFIKTVYKTVDLHKIVKMLELHFIAQAGQQRQVMNCQVA